MSIVARLKPLILSLVIAKHLLFGAKILGVRGVVRRADGAVLLVRHTYLPGWYFPGGAVDTGENAADAFVREVAEETGVRLAGPPRLVSIHLNAGVSRRDHVVFFVAEAVDEPLGPTPARFEIAETGWFMPDRLPPDTTAATLRRLAELRGELSASPTW